MKFQFYSKHLIVKYILSNHSTSLISGNGGAHVLWASLFAFLSGNNNARSSNGRMYGS